MTATPVKGVQVRGTLFSTSCPAATTATPVEGVLVRGTLFGASCPAATTATPVEGVSVHGALVGSHPLPPQQHRAQAQQRALLAT